MCTPSKSLTQDTDVLLSRGFEIAGHWFKPLRSSERWNNTACCRNLRDLLRDLE